MSYVDGFVVAVPTANRDAYLKLAETVAADFRRLGALQVVECWGDDVPEGKVTSFPMAVQCKPDETVVFAWILWPSRAVRDAAHQKLVAEMERPREPMPFDGKRMIYGGFEMVLDR